MPTILQTIRPKQPVNEEQVRKAHDEQTSRLIRQHWLTLQETQNVLDSIKNERKKLIKIATNTNSRATTEKLILDACFEAGVIDKIITLIRTGEYKHGTE